MAITPQAIKDQEFRVKLRGYDTIEVKAYLELIADEFFEMFEQAKQQTDYIDGLIEEKEELIDLRLRIEGDMTTLQRKYDKAKVDIKAADEKNATLFKEIEDMKSQIANLEWEAKEKDGLLQTISESLEGEKKEKENAIAQLASFESQWGEQQKAEIDFKETLLAGQKFSREMKNKSEEEAAKLLAGAREEAARHSFGGPAGTGSLSPGDRKAEGQEGPCPGGIEIRAGPVPGKSGRFRYCSGGRGRLFRSVPKRDARRRRQYGYPRSEEIRYGA